METKHLAFAIEALQAKQKLFHSEADFQFSLAWELQKIMPEARIRLEYTPPFARDMHIDIYITEDNGAYPIELKYKSKAIETIVDDEYFKLKNHGAQDIGRYDYLYDISRIERMRAFDKRFVAGYAIILTNEPAYWKQPQTNQTVDTAFRTHEGRMLHGSLAWADNTGLGTSKGRTEPIVLEGNYVLHWNTYSEIPNTANGLFKICTVTVK